MTVPHSNIPWVTPEVAPFTGKEVRPQQSSLFDVVVAPITDEIIDAPYSDVAVDPVGRPGAIMSRVLGIQREGVE